MNRIVAVFRVLGLIVMIFGLSMLFPLITSWLLNDGAQMAYDESLAITLVSGLLMWLIGRRGRRELQIRDGFLLVVSVWAVLPVFSALPLKFYIEGLSFTDAYFEAVSGLTATGATVLSRLDELPPSINLWRGEMMWLGGMGLIVLAVAVLPLLGIGGRQIFKAETPGPMKDSKMTPRIAETAKGLYVVYGLLSVACGLSYYAAGMNWVDAVMHAFTTMALGGFSSHDASFAYFNSPLIEGVAVLFMLMAGLNFATHFVAFRRLTVAPYQRDPEARWFLVVVLGSVIVLAFYLWARGVYGDYATAVRYSLFNVISVATTTGYASTDYALWPMFAPLWMLFLSSFASSAGSTGGGIKMMRAVILYKQVFRELVRAMHPNAVYPVKIGGESVPNQILFAVLAFGFMYMVSLVTLTLALSATGLEVVTAFASAVAMVNNLGPGLGAVGPSTTYATLTDVQIWLCTFGMLLGRLELFTLLVVLTPAFWRR